MYFLPILNLISSYGLCTIPVRFDASLLWPRSVLDFFSNLGVAPYTLGYNFCFLTYYVISIIIHIIIRSKFVKLKFQRLSKLLLIVSLLSA